MLEEGGKVKKTIAKQHLLGFTGKRIKIKLKK